jgi:hypothetical protein
MVPIIFTNFGDHVLRRGLTPQGPRNNDSLISMIICKIQSYFCKNEARVGTTTFLRSYVTNQPL